jgi:PAS domain S-box-containing protein
MTNILVIDDSEMLRQQVREAFEESHSFNAEVIEADSGLSGIEILKSQDIALVICDLVMHDLDGYAFLTMKQTNPLLVDTPVIMLTAREEMEPLIACLSAGASDYLRKPFKPQELVARCRAHIQLQKRRDEALKAYDELGRYKVYQERLYSSIPDSIIVLDPAENITQVNEAFIKLLGYTEKEILGKSIRTFLSEDDILQMTGVTTAFRRESVIHGLNASFRTKDGIRIPSTLSGSVMQSQPGSKLGYVLVAHDSRAMQRILSQESRAVAAEIQRSNQLKETQAELEFKTKAELKHAQNLIVQSEKLSALGQMIASIGHEIANPAWLSAECVGLSTETLDLLEKDLKALFDNSPEALRVWERFESRIGTLRGHLGTANTALVRLHDVSYALRTQSRHETQVSQSVDLNGVLRESRTLVSGKLKLHAIQENLIELPGVTCYRTRIGQVLTNLMANAADSLTEKADRYRRRGKTFEGTIRIASRPQAMDGQSGVALEVADNGDGVAQELRDKIFEDFFTTKPAGVGTGLGLSLCATIVKDHDGQISVEDDEQLGGAVFRVWLPLGTQLEEPTVAATLKPA